ncbi:MogA/MoaB family molybdenum cofactor biosynthesis protein [Megalodesulfovibrio paquesii]
MGDVFLMANSPAAGGDLLALTPMPPLPVGSYWGDGSTPWLQILGRVYLPGCTPHTCLGWWCRCLDPTPFFHEHIVEGTLWKTGLSLAWITMSDKGAAGQREDQGGPLIEEVARSHVSLCHAAGYLLPDEPRALKALLTDLALTQGYDLICTTGGTGLSPRDTTPEATLEVIERRLPGFEQAMMQASLAKTPMGAISRAVVGTLGQSILINLPGSPKAIRENFAAILPALPHALAKLQGDPADCAR